MNHVFLQEQEKTQTLRNENWNVYIILGRVMKISTSDALNQKKKNAWQNVISETLPIYSFSEILVLNIKMNHLVVKLVEILHQTGDVSLFFWLA